MKTWDETINQILADVCSKPLECKAEKLCKNCFEDKERINNAVKEKEELDHAKGSLHAMQMIVNTGDTVKFSDQTRFFGDRPLSEMIEIQKKYIETLENGGKS